MLLFFSLLQRSDESYSSEEGEEEITEVIVDNDDGTELDASRNEVPHSSIEKSTSHEQNTSAIKKKPVAKNTTDKRCEEIYSMIKSVHHDRQERKTQPDDFDIFGEIVARKLRNLPTRYAQITIEHQINNLLYEAELGKYNEPPQTSHVHQELSQYVRLPTVSPASSSISQSYSNPSSIQSYSQLASVQSLPNSTTTDHSSISQTYSNPPSVQSYSQLSSVQSLPNPTYLEPLAAVQPTSQSAMDFTNENRIVTDEWDRE